MAHESLQPSCITVDGIYVNPIQAGCSKHRPYPMGKAQQQVRRPLPPNRVETARKSARRPEAIMTAAEMMPMMYKPLLSSFKGRMTPGSVLCDHLSQPVLQAKPEGQSTLPSSQTRWEDSRTPVLTAPDQNLR